MKRKNKALKLEAISADKPDLAQQTTNTAKPGVTSQVSDEPVATPAAVFPIVGIGASAGGLAAFEAFFAGMPSDVDPGMAFVLVQHLSLIHI